MPDVIVALLTPFRADGDVDYDALGAHVDYLLGLGVTSFMPCGTTGECALLDPYEVSGVIARVVRAVSGHGRVIAHVGRTSTRETFALAMRASETGADALAAVVPYYYGYTDSQIAEHYFALLRGVERSLYAYTIPDRTGNQLAPSVVRELAAAGLKGVKDSTKSIDKHREYLECGVDVLMGSDSLVAEGFRMGAKGAVSAVANVHPQWLFDIAAGQDVDQSQRNVIEFRERSRSLATLKVQLAGVIPGYPTHMRAPLS